MEKKFTKKQNIMLTEIFRCINFFSKGLNTNLIVLDLPSNMKCLTDIGFVIPSGRITPRIYNWFKLTEKGQEFFKDHVLENRISDELNGLIFDGQWVIDFNETPVQYYPPK